VGDLKPEAADHAVTVAAEEVPESAHGRERVAVGCNFLHSGLDHPRLEWSDLVQPLRRYRAADMPPTWEQDFKLQVE
jgi:hypothetical protein